MTNFYFFAVVRQDYVTESDNEYVILGNDALMKCEIPSFVSDLVEVQSWTDNEENLFMKNSFNYGIQSCVLSDTS